MNSSSPYRGRFAPTPTGPLHFGSLVAAAGSYLDALAHGGEWMLRIDDVDQQRCEPGAAEAILRQLKAHGFAWHGEVQWQSQRSQAYEAAMEQLQRQGTAYACGCSRKEIRQDASEGVLGPIYPGTCREGLRPGAQARTLRVRTKDIHIDFIDRRLGPQQIDLGRDIGDFVIRRVEGYAAYHLACVADDAALGVTHIVRGVDLLPCTAPQIHLQGLLGLPQPTYLHLPLALNAQGQKLSKQNLAPALALDNASAQLWQALDFLALNPPADLKRADPQSLWAWATAAWRQAL